MEEIAKWAPWIAFAFHVLIVSTCVWVLFRWRSAGLLRQLRTAVRGILLAASVASLQVAGFGVSLIGGSTGQTWPKVLAAIGAVIELVACLLALGDANRVDQRKDRHLPALAVLRGAVGGASLSLLSSMLLLLFIIMIRWHADPKVIEGTKPYKEANTCYSTYVCPATESVIWHPTPEQPDIDALVDRGRPGILTEHDGYIIIHLYDWCDGQSKVEWRLSQDGEFLKDGILEGDEEVRIKAGVADSQNLRLVAKRHNGGSCKSVVTLRP